MAATGPSCGSSRRTVKPSAASTPSQCAAVTSKKSQPSHRQAITEVENEDESASDSSYDPSESSDDEGEEEDAALMELENDAQALARTFAEETPTWNDVNADSQPPTSSHKKPAKPSLSQAQGGRASTGGLPRDSVALSAAAPEAHSRGASVPTRPAGDVQLQRSDTVLARRATHQQGTTRSATAPGPKDVGTSSSERRRRAAEELIEWRDDSDSDEAEKLQHAANASSHQGSTDHADSEGQSSGDSDIEMLVPEAHIDIVWPERGGKISLKAQHPRVRAVAKKAIKEILASLCLTNAFPEGPEKHGRFARSALAASAEKLNHQDILERLKNDQEYARALATIPAQRVSTFRGRIKALTDPLVAAAYHLESGDSDRVAWLKDSLRYIYPGDYEKDTVEAQKPFSPPIFVQVLRNVFFNNARSIGNALAERFTSSDASRPDEKELPAPMLALVSTAIFASIADYEFDVYDAAEFSADSFADVYAENMRLLEHIKARGPRKYHLLMHRLLTDIRGARMSARGRQRTSDPLGLLNLDEMPEELE
ncbi:hypothetical protein OH77DRAFT_1430299 [Trametes cingulata]|nr:hypothetical protein OH77DRAFT_1430299 [Trametes cingulata]